jgi:hypothetical protein
VDRVDDVGVELDGRSPDAHAGVVHEDVHLSERGQGSRRDRRGRVGLCKVSFDHDRLVREIRGHLRERVGRAGHERDTGAGRVER